MISEYRHPKRTTIVGDTIDTQDSGDQGYIRLAVDYADRLLFYVNPREFFSKKHYGFQSNDSRSRINRLEDFIQELKYKNYIGTNYLYNIERLKADFLESELLREKIHMVIVSPRHYDFFLKINHAREGRGMKSFLILVKFQDRDADDLEILSLYENGKQKHLATIGGTFDTLHLGHEDYIKLAFEYADHVLIYVTSDKNVEYKKHYTVRPFEFRVEQLKSFIRSIGCDNRYEIRRLHGLKDLESEYGGTQNFGEKNSIVIVSPEYYDFFRSMNCSRVSRDLRSFLILVKPRKRDLSNNDISSSKLQHYIA